MRKSRVRNWAAFRGPINDPVRGVVVTLHPAPKPERQPKRPPKPLTRTRFRNGAASQKRGRASFPKVKNPKYRAWIRTRPCLLGSRWLRQRVSLFDRAQGNEWFTHSCWGPIDPAHVGAHQARGAPDVGHIVPLCRAAHQFYDEKRSSWARVTGFTEAKMASEAGGYALKFLETGGA